MHYLLCGVAAVYCAFWLVRGLGGGRIPDNLLRMVSKHDQRHKVMLVAYGIGLATSLAVLWMTSAEK